MGLCWALRSCGCATELANVHLALAAFWVEAVSNRLLGLELRALKDPTRVAIGLVGQGRFEFSGFAGHYDHVDVLLN